jgi:hypothetical protein
MENKKVFKKSEIEQSVKEANFYVKADELDKVKPKLSKDDKVMVVAEKDVKGQISTMIEDYHKKNKGSDKLKTLFKEYKRHFNESHPLEEDLMNQEKGGLEWQLSEIQEELTLRLNKIKNELLNIQDLENEFQSIRDLKEKEITILNDLSGENPKQIEK